MILALGLKPTRRKLPLYPPSDLRGRWVRVDQSYRGGSPEVARLLAWIDAVAAYGDPAAVAVAFESADLRERARAAGHYTEAARLLAEEADPELRAAFARPDCLEVILGYWDVDLGWHEGMSRLTYMECMVTTLSLAGLTTREIAEHEDVLSRRRRRAGETMPLEEVYKYLSTSRGKLGQLFRNDAPFEEPPTPRQSEPRGVSEHRWSQRAWPSPGEMLEEPDPGPVEDEENPVEYE